MEIKEQEIIEIINITTEITTEKELEELERQWCDLWLS